MNTAGADWFAVDVTLSYDEWMALLTLCADVHDGHGTDAGVREAAGAGWALLGRRGSAAAGVGVAPEHDQDELVRLIRDRPRPWGSRAGWPATTTTAAAESQARSGP